MPNLEINMDLNTETGSIFLSTPTASGCSYYVDTRRSKEEIAHECAAHFENYLLNELYEKLVYETHCEKCVQNFKWDDKQKKGKNEPI